MVPPAPSVSQDEAEGHCTINAALRAADTFATN